MILVVDAARRDVPRRLAGADSFSALASQTGSPGFWNWFWLFGKTFVVVHAVPVGAREFPALPLRPDHASGLEDLHPAHAGVAGGRGAVDPVPLEHLEVKGAPMATASVSTPSKDFVSSFLLLRAAQGHGADRAPLLPAQDHRAVPGRKDAAVAALSRPARAAPLRKRRRALHRLQAVRSGLPGDGDHDRERRARRRLAPHHALRHRPDQVHLLRLLRRELPGRLDRRDPHLRIPRRKARRPVLHQGHAAGRG